MEVATPRAHAADPSTRELDAEGLADYCSRPRCRNEFRRAAGPGRRQQYCSELCRRTAEKEFRQTRAQLVHFEAVVQKLRIDVAAYQREDLDEDGDQEPRPSLGARQNAEKAVERASGILRFANRDDPAVQELQALYEAVAPLILPG